MMNDENNAATEENKVEQTNTETGAAESAKESDDAKTETVTDGEAAKDAA